VDRCQHLEGDSKFFEMTCRPCKFRWEFHMSSGDGATFQGEWHFGGVKGDMA
jgi:hypothetical protein